MSQWLILIKSPKRKLFTANITYLDCGNNMIQELNIEKNKNLKTLYCDNNNFDCKALKAKLNAVPNEDIIDASEALQFIQ